MIDLCNYSPFYILFFSKTNETTERLLFQSVIVSMLRCSLFVYCLQRIWVWFLQRRLLWQVRQQHPHTDRVSSGTGLRQRLMDRDRTQRLFLTNRVTLMKHETCCSQSQLWLWPTLALVGVCEYSSYFSFRFETCHSWSLRCRASTNVIYSLFKV